MIERLTIVIPFYNDRDNLIPLLDSINVQKCDFVDSVIIVDDGSKQKLDLNLDDYNFKLMLLYNERNRGTGFTRNRLFESCKTKYLLSVDSDCKFINLDDIEKIWNARERADIVYPLVTLSDGARIHPRNELEEQYIRMSTCFMINLEKVRTADLSFRNYFIFFYEDEDFFIECQKNKLTSSFLREVNVVHARDVSGIGVRGFLEYEWYTMYRGLFFMHMLHGKEYFKTREIVTLKELYEMIFHPSYCPGRFKGFLRAVLMFTINLPRFYWSRIAHKRF